MTGYDLGAAVILLLLQGSSLTAGQTATHASETSLRATLQSGYDQATRPYTPTYIDMIYYIRSVQALDIANQQLSQTALIRVMWDDPRLVWDPTAYSNITDLDINWTWRPMFGISNSVDSTDLIGSDNDVAKVTVFSNGSMFWQYTMLATTSCDVNILNFPYDEQECFMYFNYFGNNANNLDFNLSSTEFDTSFYLTNHEWHLVSSALLPVNVAACCPQTTMSYLLAKVKFKRLHTFYVNTFLIPTILLSICLVWPFYLPTESGERLGFSLTILLSYTVVLSMTSEFLPTTSQQVPYLAHYLVGVLFMCCIATCNVALHVKLFYIETPPPGYMKETLPSLLQTFYRKMKPIVFMECLTRQRRKIGDRVLTVASVDQDKPPAIDEKVREDTTASPSEEEEITWVTISKVMDRTCFVMYCLGVFIMDVVLMTFLSAGSI